VPYDTRTHLFANNAQSRLVGSISNAQTTIIVSAGTGSRFPSPIPNEIFKLSIYNFTTGDVEIVHVTQRVGDLMTVERGQEGTTPTAFPEGSSVVHTVTAQTLEWLQSLVGG
jgi:hypothetical protein